MLEFLCLRIHVTDNILQCLFTSKRSGLLFLTLHVTVYKLPEDLDLVMMSKPLWAGVDVGAGLLYFCNWVLILVMSYSIEVQWM